MKNEYLLWRAKRKLESDALSGDVYALALREYLRQLEALIPEGHPLKDAMVVEEEA